MAQFIFLGKKCWRPRFKPRWGRIFFKNAASAEAETFVWRELEVALYLRNGWSLTLPSIELCVFGISSMDSKHKASLFTVYYHGCLTFLVPESWAGFCALVQF